MRRTALAAMCGLLASPIAAGQAPGAPRFEVVSVRENPSATRGGAMSAPTGSQFTVTNIPLRMIIGQCQIGPQERPACSMVVPRNYVLAGTRTTAQLARALESVVGRPVVDETGPTLDWEAP